MSDQTTANFRCGSDGWPRGSGLGFEQLKGFAWQHEVDRADFSHHGAGDHADDLWRRRSSGVSLPCMISRRRRMRNRTRHGARAHTTFRPFSCDHAAHPTTSGRVQLERRMQGANGKFSIFIGDQHADLDFGRRDHLNVDPLSASALNMWLLRHQHDCACQRRRWRPSRHSDRSSSQTTGSYHAGHSAPLRSGEGCRAAR